jgi:hypothetical protein
MEEDIMNFHFGKLKLSKITLIVKAPGYLLKDPEMASSTWIERGNSSEKDVSSLFGFSFGSRFIGIMNWKETSGIKFHE